ncbi:MAG TPA: endonuclease III, partial [Acholeplasmatales bacterium]|nr:endonuclease III [Acholeplasmatales bacterium]
MFPIVHSELNFQNAYELTIAVILSAQTTDISVNKATKVLFQKYPDFQALAQATFEEVHECIRFLGLSSSKTKHIIALSQELVAKAKGIIIPDFDFLISLPGIGRKSANVILSEGFGVPRIAVDTHVLRVANRLGFIVSNDPLKVENRLMESYDPASWHQVHLR